MSWKKWLPLTLLVLLAALFLLTLFPGGEQAVNGFKLFAVQAGHIIWVVLLWILTILFVLFAFLGPVILGILIRLGIGKLDSNVESGVWLSDAQHYVAAVALAIFFGVLWMMVLPEIVTADWANYIYRAFTVVRIGSPPVYETPPLRWFFYTAIVFATTYIMAHRAES